MLSSDQIADALTLPSGNPSKLTVVPAPNQELLRARGGTSIDLRLGRWFRSFKQTRTNSVALTAHNDSDGEMPTEISRTKQHFVPFGSSYVLHPGRFVLGATLEWLRLPADLSGYVTGKSSLGRHGLVIETAAGIHPHFAGCLTLELANIGEIPLEIFPGMPKFARFSCTKHLHPKLAISENSRGAGSQCCPRPNQIASLKSYATAEVAIQPT